MPPLLGLILFLAAGLLLGLLALTGWTLHRLRHPPRRTYASALAQGRPAQPDQLPARDGTGAARTFESWTVESRGLSLPVWDFPGDGPPNAPVFILTHGWGDSRIGALTRAQALLPLASRFIAWDIPGHGDAPGACVLGVSEHEALRNIIERVNSDRVVLLGWSLGAGISIAAMSNWQSDAVHRVLAIIAEAPYCLPQTPARNMMRAFGLPSTANLPFAMAAMRVLSGATAAWQHANGPFDRAALARTITCPLLVIHGSEDAISPVEDGHAIASAAPQADILVLPGAGHYSLWTQEDSRAAVLQRIRSLLATLSAAAP